jgi:superfamily I DNA/RNA helicase
VISTLHGSKGLEFGRVHIINIIEDKIPAEDKDVLGMVHVEEERRLFYVGITRAEKRLYLHFVSQPSYFLKEAECDLTKKALLKLRERSKNSQTFLSEIKHSR